MGRIDSRYGFQNTKQRTRKVLCKTVGAPSRVFPSASVAAKVLGLKPNTVFCAIRDKSLCAGKYTFEYA